VHPPANEHSRPDELDVNENGFKILDDLPLVATNPYPAASNVN
jgi:hypothetical protein